MYIYIYMCDEIQAHMHGNFESHFVLFLNTECLSRPRNKIIALGVPAVHSCKVMIFGLQAP